MRVDIQFCLQKRQYILRKSLPACHRKSDFMAAEGCTMHWKSLASYCALVHMKRPESANDPRADPRASVERKTSNDIGESHDAGAPGTLISVMLPLNEPESDSLHSPLELRHLRSLIPPPLQDGLYSSVCHPCDSKFGDTPTAYSSTKIKSVPFQPQLQLPFRQLWSLSVLNFPCMCSFSCFHAPRS